MYIYFASGNSCAQLTSKTKESVTKMYNLDKRYDHNFNLWGDIYDVKYGTCKSAGYDYERKGLDRTYV